MLRRLLHRVVVALVFLISASTALAIPIDQNEVSIEYRLEKLADLKSFGGPQLALLEKLNRADASHLARLPHILVPITWKTELEHSPFPAAYPAAQSTPKLIVVDQPSQAFAAYENGVQVHWGPISSGRQQKPTPSGVYYLNWKARTRNSTLSGEWKLNWYFNFHNKRGLAFHEFDLPGVPMSHACVRLLARDAEWIYKWGEGWTVDKQGQLVKEGTPVIIMGSYAFGAPPPWLVPGNASITVTLPTALPQ